jgi:nucleosome binding factor SPN SPT16 subunit
VRSKDNEEANKQDLVDQEKLVLLKGKRPTLTELQIRPNISGKKSTGALEVHQNGLRF